MSQLPQGWNDQDVLDVLQTAGAIERITFFNDEFGAPTGAASVVYAEPFGARNAVRELDEASLGGTHIRVSLDRGVRGKGKGGGGGKGAGFGFGGGFGGGKGWGWGGKGRSRSASRSRSEPRGGSWNRRSQGRAQSQGRGGGKGRVTRQTMSTADLDAQLEQFIGA